MTYAEEVVEALVAFGCQRTGAIEIVNGVRRSKDVELSERMNVDPTRCARLVLLDIGLEPRSPLRRVV
jgi:hypothetical protein